MECKLCGDVAALVKAHIIPEGLFRRLRKGNRSLLMFTNKSGEHTKRSPVGVYDKTIVCNNCEQIWQEWDRYAQELLVNDSLNGRIKYVDDTEICYVIDNYDYKRLKLFFISLAWRASVSSQFFYEKISLGKFEDIARNHILDDDPGGSELFSVVIARFDHPSAKPMLDPHDGKINGVNFLRFYLAGYIAYIKVDDKPTPYPYSHAVLTESKPLYIVLRDFTKSKELDLMKAISSR